MLAQCDAGNCVHVLVAVAMRSLPTTAPLNCCRYHLLHRIGLKHTQCDPMCITATPRHWIGASCPCVPQSVVVPDKFCDSRVRVMQADARTLPPTVLQEYAPGVRKLGVEWGVG